MKKVYLAQTTLVFGLAAGLAIGVPTFIWRVSGTSHKGVLLVNGRIEGIEVAIGTKLPGRIAKMHVQEGQEVRANTLLVELESHDVEAALEQARANVRQAKHNYGSSNEQVIRAEAQLKKARTGLDLVRKQTDLMIQQARSAVLEAEAAVEQASALESRAQTDFDHSQQLRKEKAATDLEYAFATDALKAQKAAVRMVRHKLDQARHNLAMAEAKTSEISMQENDIVVMESTVRQAKAAVQIAKAQLDAAEASARILELQLKDTKIYAPCDGVVVTRVMEPGEIVTAGATVLVVVDFDKLYLKGYLPNTEISRVKLNDPARLFLDAFPDKSFDARVTKVNSQAEFTPKNVDTPQQRVKLVFGVELRVDNADRIFKPGMPADAVIRTDPAVPWCTPGDLR